MSQQAVVSSRGPRLKIVVRLTGILMVMLGLLAVACAWLGRLPYESASGTYQLVEESQSAALFGGGGEPIGTPQVYVVQDKSAVLPEKDEAGNQQLSLTKLKAKGEYPLQLRSVNVVAGYVQLGGAILALLGALAWVYGSAAPKRTLAID